MRLLALDTAGDGCSVGIFASSRPLALRRHAGASGHAEQLPRLLADLLADAPGGLQALDALAVTIGPGSFSGIRTGLAAARGLALVAGLPVFGITTFAALAAAALRGSSSGRPIVAAIDARRSQVFVQVFDADGHPISPARAATLQAAAADLVGPLRLVGSGARLLRPLLRPETEIELDDVRLDAAAVAEAAMVAAGRGMQPVRGTTLGPLYLRDADARLDAGRSLLPVEG